MYLKNKSKVLIYISVTNAYMTCTIIFLTVWINVYREREIDRKKERERERESERKADCNTEWG